MKKTNVLSGLLASALPLPARLALSYGPQALRAYGDWRSLNGRAKATAKHAPRGLAALTAPRRRAGFPWGVGLGGVALGALGTGAAVAGARFLPAKLAPWRTDAARSTSEGAGPTVVTRRVETTNAPTTRTTVETGTAR